MGPKHQQSESKKRNKDREEFSDCDITDDEETRGIEHIAEEEHKENKDNLAENGPTNRRGKEDNVIENDTTATASVIETTPSTCSKPVSHQLPKICTQVFIIQLLISVICLLFANYIHVSYLHAQFHAKDVIEVTVNELFKNTAAETIGNKAEEWVNMAVKNIIDKQMEHVTNELVTDVIDSKVARSIETMLVDKDLTLLKRATGLLISSFESQFTNIYDDAKHNHNTELVNFHDQLIDKSKNIEDQIHTDIINKIQQEINDFKHELKIVGDKVRDVTNNVQTLETELDKKVLSINDAINQLHGTANIITKNIDKQSQVLKEQNSISAEHEQFQDKLKQEIVGMETLIEDAKTKIKGLQSNVVLINQTLDTLLSGTVQQLNKIQSDAELLLKERQTGLETNKDTVINIVMLLFTMLCVLSLLVYRLYQQPYGTVDLSRDSSRRSLNNMNSNAILNHIPSSPVLERMLCIISFDEDRQRIHKMLLMSAGIKDDVVKCHVIRRHNQIPDLPRCRVYLMCAEFTERHVIIEEQGLGLGDLHRTTYDAVHKLGGRLIILYTRDPGSRRLKDDQSYNNTIYCVTNQSELAVINMEGCFFSIYDTLNEGQKTRLKNKINQYLQ